MKKLILAFAIAAFSSAAMAGSPSTPVAVVPAITPPPPPAPVARITDWSGFYAGGTAGFATGGNMQEVSGGTVGTTHGGFEGTMYGAFAGYNFQRGSLVFGGELDYMFGNFEAQNPASSEYKSMIDLKARAGYAMGNALLYGFVGGSAGDYNTNIGGTTNPYAMGYNYGVGLDFLVTDNIFVGAEYMIRDMSVDFDGSNDGANTKTDAAQIRVGWKF